MGVPSFYRWLARRYPKVVADVVEEEIQFVGSQSIPINTSKANPNGREFDCLYLDMNGIIHPCCHPEDKPAPTTEDEMMHNVFEYIDRIFAMVRPRKLLYMAIDGVAPRAKMNQQRSRRFRAVREAKERSALDAKLRKDWTDRGRKPPPAKPASWDSNVITPGTPFMAKLADALHYYIKVRLHSDPGWRGIKVMFSDAKMPGEGEHKIMNFIRLQRAQAGYDPNLRHCLYGMDADLIMLGLATHEPHFSIIREQVIDHSARKCHVCGQQGHLAADCTGAAKQKSGAFDELGAAGQKIGPQRPFQFLHLSVLREYLKTEFNPSQPLPFAWDLERMIDDFVFLCFFVGNDFLPHLPSLEIREGAIEKLMALHMKLLPAMGGYLTEQGVINLTRVSVILSELGVGEDEVFRARKAQEDHFKERDRRNRERTKQREDAAARRDEHQKQNEQQRQAFLAQNQWRGFGGPAPAAGTSGRGLHINANAHAPPMPPAIAAAMGYGAAPGHVADWRRGPNGPAPGTEPAVGPAAPTAATAAPAALTIATTPTAAAAVAAAAPVPSPASAAATPSPRLPLGSPQQTKATIADQEQNRNAAKALRKGLVGGKRKADGVAASPSAAVTVASPAAAANDSANAETIAAANAAASAVAAASAALAALPPDTVKRLKIDASGAAVPGTAPALHVQVPAGASAAVVGAAAGAAAAAAAPNPVSDADFAKSLKDIQEKLNQPDPTEDDVRLHEAGWKERYYYNKLQLDMKKDVDKPALRRLFQSYAEGLSWVMLYYYRGVPSWSWFYPFHYAPMASDLMNMDDYKINFDLSKPFSPFGQLMAVLPAGSAHAMPSACRRLMVEPESPIIDFYPDDFALDMNGKKFTWQAVALLPWIDPDRLLSTLSSVESTFTDEEKERNADGRDYLYVHMSNPLAASLTQNYVDLAAKNEETGPPSDDQLAQIRWKINIKESGGISGFASPYAAASLPGSDAECPLQFGNHPTINNLAVVSVVYHLPPYAPHSTKLLPGVKMPAPVLTESEAEQQIQYSNAMLAKQSAGRGGAGYRPPRRGDSAASTSAGFGASGGVSFQPGAGRGGPMGGRPPQQFQQPFGGGRSGSGGSGGGYQTYHNPAAAAGAGAGSAGGYVPLAAQPQSSYALQLQQQQLQLQQLQHLQQLQQRQMMMGMGMPGLMGAVPGMAGLPGVGMGMGMGMGGAMGLQPPQQGQWPGAPTGAAPQPFSFKPGGYR